MGLLSVFGRPKSGRASGFGDSANFQGRAGQFLFFRRIFLVFGVRIWYNTAIFWVVSWGTGMLHYLENLFRALDLGSMGQAALRVAAIFLCLTVHETCHGLAAYALGDPTAKSMHRLSMNPLRHIDWFGLLMMFAVGFGWAKPVPVDPRYFRNPKRGMAVTALAGPVSNLILAAAAILAARFIALSDPVYPALRTIFHFCLYMLAPLSVGLGLFNLLPIPPLDGAKVLGVLLPERTYFRLMRYERYGLLVLLALSLTGVGDGWISKAIYHVYDWLIDFIF